MPVFYNEVHNYIIFTQNLFKTLVLSEIARLLCITIYIQHDIGVSG